MLKIEERTRVEITRNDYRYPPHQKSMLKCIEVIRIVLANPTLSQFRSNDGISDLLVIKNKKVGILYIEDDFVRDYVDINLFKDEKTATNVVMSLYLNTLGNSNAKFNQSKRGTKTQSSKGCTP
jgi:hypothetical protein